MSSDAVVELPPFKRCSNAPISFSNASNFDVEKLLLVDDERVLLLLSEVVKGRREDVTVRGKKADEINC